MRPKAAWDALEDRYRTPPEVEEANLRRRRRANRTQARWRLQTRQLARLLDAERAMVAEGRISQNKHRAAGRLEARVRARHESRQRLFADNRSASAADRPTNSTAGVRPAVSALADQSTSVHEGKQEEDDPAEHQRRYAAAYAEGLRLNEAVQRGLPVVLSPESTADPAIPSTSQLAAKRARKSARQRGRRANMTLSQKEAAHRKDTEQRRARRAIQPEDERHRVRVHDCAAHAARRAENDERHHVARDADCSARLLRRSIHSEAERVEERSIRHQARPSALGEEGLQVERDANRQQHQARRAALTEEERREERERVRLRRRTKRLCPALANHEDFTEAMITGSNVVDGRHRLPSTSVCEYCNAWKWPKESKIACCLANKVRLPPLRPAPPRLLQLYGDKEFRKLVRAYNQVFAFTSIGVNQDRSVAGQRGVYTYRIQGAMAHYMGSLLPPPDPRSGERSTPKFAQIYIVDPDMHARARIRRGIFAELDPVALLDIEQIMADNNPFAQQFLSFGQIVRQHDMRQVVDLVFNLHADPLRPGTHNLPTVSEVGATMIEAGNIAQPRDLLLYTRDQRLLRLFETNANYDPLQYPLLFPFGELGWTFTDEYADGAMRHGKYQMPLREHVTYRLHQKADDRSALHQGGRLFQQYCVDQRAKCEQEQLRWVATHQREIRADQYSGLRDAFLAEVPDLGDGEGLLAEYDRGTGELAHLDEPAHPDRSRNRHFLNQVGKKVILPSSHSGSPRQMYKSYQDSMAIVREYGKPDLFVTMTCNPKWEEILEKVPEDHQSAQDRPDEVARVWQQKLDALLKDLNEGVLGHVIARIYVVEFQKRGLPHAHILIILADEDKPRTRQLIDKLVSAELPDARTLPALYTTVMTCMLHGPCGAANPICVCMKDGKCSKGFPKPFVDITRANEDGFPLYRRRRRPEGILEFNGKSYDNATVNQWVVPYNPYLSQKYNCHINVEVCAALSAVKYLYKYVYKGSDMAMVSVETVQGGAHTNHREPNEIIRYLNARYISPVEACMRLLGHPVQGKTHSVIQLPVRVEDEQSVVFGEREDPARVLRRSTRTMLTAFFEICASELPDNQIAKCIVYQDFPKHFRWDLKHKRWVRRKKYEPALGRMVHVSPRDADRFYLRVLLCHRKGPTSFADLRTVGTGEDALCDNYQDAAVRLGFLENDAEWAACMQEAANFQMPCQLRQLFAKLLVYAQVAQVHQLWDDNYDALSHDFAYLFRDMEGWAKANKIMFNTLKSLDDLLQVSERSLANFDLPQLSEFPDLEALLDHNNILLQREYAAYDHDVLQDIVDHEAVLNAGQQAIYRTVMRAVDVPLPGYKLFFIDGPGGTGKSTLLKHILAKVRLSGKVAIAVASSGIASLLLMGGRTAHSIFRIPLRLNSDSTCNIAKQSPMKELIRKASLVIWDEAPMTHRHAFEAVDRCLRDTLDNDVEPFGGKVFVLSGDFRQILPVVVRGTPAETIDACLKSSELWEEFEQLHLTENMRVMAAVDETTAEELAQFSEFLLQIGEGKHQVNPALGSDFVKIPREMLFELTPITEDEEAEDIRPGAVPRGMKRLIDEMYAGISTPEIATDEYFAERTVLTTTNAEVQRINAAVSERLEGEAHEYLSNDSVEGDDDRSFFEAELLHSVNSSGIPPHKLTLKKGTPIMLMRNLNPDLGLCNGTRLRVVELRRRVIHATIMTGERQGQHVFIPRIVFISDGNAREFPFRLRRKQFPVQPAFAMTINKAQGQTAAGLP